MTEVITTFEKALIDIREAKDFYSIAKVLDTLINNKDVPINDVPIRLYNILFKDNTKIYILADNIVNNKMQGHITFTGENRLIVVKTEIEIYSCSFQNIQEMLIKGLAVLKIKRNKE